VPFLQVTLQKSKRRSTTLTGGEQAAGKSGTAEKNKRKALSLLSLLKGEEERKLL